MKLEVELKFPVADIAGLESRLTKLGAAISAPQIEVDTYFAHPARDFSRTDEALRLRRKNGAYSITYKGPKIDAATKTRCEIDLPLATDEAGFPAWFGLLDALGFTAVGQVRKSRRKSHILWQDQSVEVSLDEVQRLGSFVELELIVEVGRDCPNFRVNENGTVPLIAGSATLGRQLNCRPDNADISTLDSAKGCIVALAEKLGLSGSERRSYLELLLEQ